LLAGWLAQFGLLVAIGDAAVELMYWQMGTPHASLAQMAALASRYESAVQSSARAGTKGTGAVRDRSRTDFSGCRVQAGSDERGGVMLRSGAGSPYLIALVA
jgi:hypothetical protein